MSHQTQLEHFKIRLEAIQLATNNFSENNCIGRGGFGKVYKGKLVIDSKGAIMVAMKRLDRALGQGDIEFRKEIMMLPLYKHENIVSLLGYCDEYGERILVYEYLSKKSLDSYLTSDNLTWVQRLRICVGAARGLAYLHTPTEAQLRTIHRDIKSSNILLDHNWNAKISDFGLSKYTPASNQLPFLLSNPAGTLAYIDPEYHKTGELTKESDVYSFGVMLFEVLCGKLCFGNNLIGSVRKYYAQNKLSELVCHNIKDEINMSSLKLFADIAYQCIGRKREGRPLMTKVVSALEKALDVQEKADAEVHIQRAHIAQRVRRAGALHVKVLKITDVRRRKNPSNASSYYLVLYIDGDDTLQNIKKTQNYNKENAESEWNQEFTLYLQDAHVQDLYISVNEVVSENKHRHLGKCKQTLVELTRFRDSFPKTFNLKVWDENYPKPNFNIQVEMLYIPMAYYHIRTISRSVQKAPLSTPKNGGYLNIIIHGAILTYKEEGHSSHVSLLFRGQSRKTKSMINTNTPMWLQDFAFMLEQPPTKENMHLEIIDELIPEKGTIGYVDISLADVVNKKLISESYQVKQGNDKAENYLKVELHWRTT